MCVIVNVEEVGFIIVLMYLVFVFGVEKLIGIIEIYFLKLSKGLVFILDLVGLKFGSYGFYIYENFSCELGMKVGVKIVAVVVGGYYDFEGKQFYKVLWENGYKGDLLVFIVILDGMVRMFVFVLCLELDDIDG